MSNQRRLLNRQPKTLDERYFNDIRPTVYERHAKHYQFGVRTGRTLAEHLDSACQFILTVTHIAGVPENQRPIILAATAVHDLNKLDSSKRNVKTLARDREFLQQQLELACVAQFVSTDEDFELVRKLIERHSGHNVSDGARFLPEDPAIERYAAMVTAADLFDLGIPESERFAKVQKELTVAFDRPCNLYRLRVSEDRGYITALLLSAAEEILTKYGFHPLAIFSDGELFEVEVLPNKDLTQEIAATWQKKINAVFGGNIEQLVRPTKDGIKIDPQAIQQNLEETLVCVQALLAKKQAGFKFDKVNQDVNKWGNTAGEDAVNAATILGLLPVSKAEEFAISEGLKTAYLSYGKAGLKPQEAWNRIANHIGLSQEQGNALEPFNAQYGRCLFAAKAASNGMEGVKAALRESFQMRQGEQSEDSEEIEVSEEMMREVARLLKLPNTGTWQGINDLDTYINANPKQRCSLGTTSTHVEELISNNMPPGTKVQSFSNRLPGGMSAEPKRRADSIVSLAYQLMAVGANFPAVSKQDPLYLDFALPEGACPELLRIWKKFLRDIADINAEGAVTVDELKLYRDNILEFKPNKVVGFALPKRSDFIHSTVIIPVVWGDANASVALLKSLHLALEVSLSLEFGFPFTISGNLEVEAWSGSFGKVEGIPSTLQPLLGNGKYNRQEAEEILKRLRCIAKLAVSVASLQNKDDCLYDLARAAKRPLVFYYVLLRWILREQDEPNLEYSWSRICEPLNDLLESLMPDDEKLTKYLKEAAQIAAEAKLWGSSFKRTAQAEPFTALIAAVRNRKPHLPWDVVFAALIQDYHTRLDRIREHGVGATKYEQIKKYYEVLRQLFAEVYQDRPERFLDDKKTLEAAYLFFLQEARQQVKNKAEYQSVETTTSAI
ncbi:CRISPR-associated protein Csc3 [Floridanema evergladense]|uniref:CRISPR-associated protein Csc3 n=1 Tax=Floridaenema evergladense BLCC-F167 TaxID=3153639 RepID=A0ABV4WJ82_9CYAN